MEGILNEVARFREGKKPENGRQGLKKYDPEAYGLFGRFYTEGTEIPKMEPRRKKPPVRGADPHRSGGPQVGPNGNGAAPLRGRPWRESWREPIDVARLRPASR
jgi:hypothetical protein